MTSCRPPLRAVVLLLTVSAASVARAETPGPIERSPEAVSQRSATLQAAVGSGAALLAAPASLALGAWIGTGTSNLFLGALPALLVVLAGPPLAVVFTERWIGNLYEPGRMRVSPAVWAALGTQLFVLVGAILLGAQYQSIRDVAFFTAIDVVALPLVTTLLMRGTASDGAAQSAQEHSALGFALPRVASAPVISWAF